MSKSKLTKAEAGRRADAKLRGGHYVGPGPRQVRSMCPSCIAWVDAWVPPYTQRGNGRPTFVPETPTARSKAMRAALIEHQLDPECCAGHPANSQGDGR